MAIVVLVLWLFTASAGFYLLATSNLGRARAAATTPATQPATAPAESATVPAESATVPAAAATATATTSATADATAGASATPVAAPAAAAGSTAQTASKREIRRAARDRFDPPSLTAAKSAPAVPGLRSLLEFAHPAFAIVGLGFWLAFTMVHDRALGWVAFGLVTATVCLGLTWYTANTRAARREGPPGSEPAPAFRTRLVLLHGSAATVTFALAALTALVLSR
ncbi:MAG: hypothetical protein ACRDOC_01575 [Streptosporangiaceae bacterium]